MQQTFGFFWMIFLGESTLNVWIPVHLEVLSKKRMSEKTYETVSMTPKSLHEKIVNFTFFRILSKVFESNFALTHKNKFCFNLWILQLRNQ